MDGKLSTLINSYISQGEEINSIIRNGVASIDRKVWLIGDEPYTDYLERNDPLPEKFSITSYRMDKGILSINWETYFRGETDDYGTFEIPELYFNEPDAYKSALVLAEQKLYEKVRQKEAMEALRETQTKEDMKKSEADLLEVLLAKRERGEI